MSWPPRLKYRPAVLPAAPRADISTTSSRARAIRRFLSHVLPKGFHRIRHYGLFASGHRTANIARARELIGAAPRVVEPEEQKAADPDQPRVLPLPCPRCDDRIIVIEVFARGCEPTYRPKSAATPIGIEPSRPSPLL